MRKIVSRVAATARRLAVCQDGSNAVEAAIVLPVLVLAIVGSMMEGWMLYSTNMLVFAVQSAARCAAVNTTTCGGATQPTQIAAVKTYAVSQAWALNLTAANFTVTPGAACGWQVSGTYPFTFVLPFAAGNPTYNITANACFPTD
jgi:Flp pilus assembly protein TadG